MKSLEKIKDLEKQQANAFEELKEELLKTLNPSVIEKAVRELDESKELTWIENDDFLHQWIRFNLNTLTNADLDNPLVKEALESILYDHDFMHIDFENDCLTKSIGPSLFINDKSRGYSGYKIYDQEERKNIGSYKEFDEAINAARKYQDKIGIYNSIVRADQHENYFFV